MKYFLSFLVLFFVGTGKLFCQTAPVFDSTDASLISGKNWISSTWGFGVNLGGGVHGLGGGVSLRYSYVSVTVGITDYSNSKFRPTDVSDDYVPTGNYEDVGFPTPIFHITGDVTIPVYDRFAVKGSAGACRKSIDYVSKSSIATGWFKSHKEDDILFTRFVIGGEVNYRAWGHLVIGVGAMSDLGGYISIGGVF